MDTNIATKEDLKKLTTKAELKQVEKNLRHEILRVEERVEGLEVRMDKLEVRMDRLETKMGEFEAKMTLALTRLQNTLDGFVGTVDDLRIENQVGAHQYRELEIRVTKLESSSRTV